MLVALPTSITVLVLAAGCAHRLWFSAKLWQALLFLPPMLAAWAASLIVRTPTDMGALMTFLTGDMALYVLAILGVMRMLGGLPVGLTNDDGGSWSDDDDAPEPPAPNPPAGPARRELGNRPRNRGPQPQRPRPPRRVTTRRLPDRDAPRASRAPSTSWSGRSD